MEIPKRDIEGVGQVYLVSPTQLRTYGAGGFRLAEQEEPRGCPRQYRKKYVERVVPDTGPSYELAYGRLVHDALEVMENHQLDPVAALDRVFPADLTPEAYQEALGDLTAYLEREASPSDRYGALATEVNAMAPLYVDEEFGPVWMQGYIDWLGIDLEVPDTVHVVDYKTNRSPASEKDVLGDVQMKTYDWLLRQTWQKWLPRRPVRIVTHLDAIKFREIEVSFTDDDIDAWHAWAIAVVRTILRDEHGPPVLNPGCAYCPVRGDCPAFLALPDAAKQVLEGKPDPAEDDARLTWRDQANAVRLLLEKAVKEIDAEFKERTFLHGTVETEHWRFRLDTEWGDETDVAALHAALGDDLFYRLASVPKGKLKAAVKDWPTDRVSAVWQATRRVPQGTTVKKEKR